MFCFCGMYRLFFVFFFNDSFCRVSVPVTFAECLVRFSFLCNDSFLSFRDFCGMSRPICVSFAIAVLCLSSLFGGCLVYFVNFCIASFERFNTFDWMSRPFCDIFRSCFVFLRPLSCLFRVFSHRSLWSFVFAECLVHLFRFRHFFIVVVDKWLVNFFNDVSSESPTFGLSWVSIRLFLS